MDGFTMTPEMEARALGRRRILHPFARLDPARTAVIVVDMQIAYMDAVRGFADMAAAHAIVPPINRLVAGARAAGAGVFWLRHTIAGSDDSWTVMAELEDPCFRQRRIETLSEGSSGHGIHESLDVQPEDTVCLKNRFSAFLPGSSDLPDLLEARGIDTVLITGIATHACCESTARDAIMRNYRAVMIADGTATASAELQQASLAGFFEGIGDVYDVATALASLAAAERARPAAA